MNLQLDCANFNFAYSLIIVISRFGSFTYLTGFLLRRAGYAPAAFRPKLNPFYIALPYNDIGSDFRHRPEASEVIPWFWRDYRGEGISVCKGRWVAVHKDGKVCYAQWEDVGPFQTDHWEYVFQGAEPRNNRNNGAGIDVSPAVRDFLGLRSGERVQWRFIEARDVPSGPWKGWESPENQPFQKITK